MWCSVHILFPSVLTCSNLRLHQRLQVKNIFKQENAMLQLTFNPGLTLTGFRTTRPRSTSQGNIWRRLHDVFKLNSQLVPLSNISSNKSHNIMALGQIVRSCSLTHRINYKFMCLSAYWHWKLANERARSFYVTPSNREELKTFLLPSCIRGSKFISLYNFSCLVWKPAQFEVQSNGGGLHTALIAFVAKYTLI